MKKYLKEWWTIYAIGIFSGLITTVKKDNGDNIDYWWLPNSVLIFFKEVFFPKVKSSK